MSSHHIVRDQQEPALLIANGQPCSFELLQSLLEWSPYVCVLDGAIGRVLELNIKIDAWLGDFDSTFYSIEEVLQRQYPIEIIPAPDQSFTDLEKGIHFLIEKGFTAVNIIWATGKRADHTLANILNITKYVTKIKITALDDHSRIFPILPHPYVFKKWYTQNTPISLFPVPIAKHVTTDNLRYELNDNLLQIGKALSNSNHVKETGEIQVTYKEGSLLIMECFG